MENNENMAQPSAFRPIMNSKEKLLHEIREKIRLVSKNDKKTRLFNCPANWPVYTKYLPSKDLRYTGL